MIVRVRPLQYFVTVRIRCFAGRVVRRTRIFAEDRLPRHLRFTSRGVVAGSFATRRTEVVCCGFFFAASAPGGASSAKAASARRTSATAARATWVMAGESLRETSGVRARRRAPD